MTSSLAAEAKVVLIPMDLIRLPQVEGVPLSIPVHRQHESSPEVAAAPTETAVLAALVVTEARIMGALVGMAPLPTAQLLLEALAASAALESHR